MNEQKNKDLLHLAMIQNHIESLDHDQQVRTYNLAERIRAVLRAESEDVMHAAHALVSAELLVNLDGGFFNE